MIRFITSCTIKSGSINVLSLDSICKTIDFNPDNLKTYNDQNTLCETLERIFGKLLNDNLAFSTVQFTGFAVDVYSGTTGCTETAGNQTEAESKVTSVAATGGPSFSTFNWTITSELDLLEN